MNKIDSLKIKDIVERHGYNFVNSILNESFAEGSDSILGSLFAVNGKTHIGVDGKEEAPLSIEGVQFLRAFPLMWDKIKNSDVTIYIDDNLKQYMPDSKGEIGDKVLGRNSSISKFNTANSTSSFKSDIIDKIREFQEAANKVSSIYSLIDKKISRADANGEEVSSDIRKLKNRLERIYNSANYAIEKMPDDESGSRRKKGGDESEKWMTSDDMDFLNSDDFKNLYLRGDWRSANVSFIRRIYSEIYDIIKDANTQGLRYQIRSMKDSAFDGYANVDDITKVLLSDYLDALCGGVKFDEKMTSEEQRFFSNIEKNPLFNEDDKSKFVELYKEKVDEFNDNVSSNKKSDSKLKNPNYVYMDIFKYTYNDLGYQYDDEDVEKFKKVYSYLKKVRSSYESTIRIYNNIYNRVKDITGSDKGRVKNNILQILNNYNFDTKFAGAKFSGKKLSMEDMNLKNTDNFGVSILTDRNLKILYVVYFIDFIKSMAFVPTTELYGWSNGDTPSINVSISSNKFKKYSSIMDDIMDVIDKMEIPQINPSNKSYTEGYTFDGEGNDKTIDFVFASMKRYAKFREYLGKIVDESDMKNIACAMTYKSNSLTPKAIEDDTNISMSFNILPKIKRIPSSQMKELSDVAKNVESLYTSTRTEDADETSFGKYKLSTDVVDALDKMLTKYNVNHEVVNGEDGKDEIIIEPLNATDLKNYMDFLKETKSYKFFDAETLSKFIDEMKENSEIVTIFKSGSLADFKSKIYEDYPYNKYADDFRTRFIFDEDGYRNSKGRVIKGGERKYTSALRKLDVLIDNFNLMATKNGLSMKIDGLNYEAINSAGSHVRTRGSMQDYRENLKKGSDDENQELRNSRKNRRELGDIGIDSKDFDATIQLAGKTNPEGFDTQGYKEFINNCITTVRDFTFKPGLKLKDSDKSVNDAVSSSDVTPDDVIDALLGVRDVITNHYNGFKEEFPKVMKSCLRILKICKKLNSSDPDDRDHSLGDASDIEAIKSCINDINNYVTKIQMKR